MGSIFTLFNLIAQIGLVGIAFLLIYAFLKEQKIKEARNEVQMLQARISMLRISLKAKVKKKSNGFRNLFHSILQSAVTPDDPVDRLLTNLANLAFERSADFETYFALNHEINNQLRNRDNIAEAAENTEPSESLQDQIQIAQSAKLKINQVDELNSSSDPIIYRIIREISATSRKLKVAVEHYNHLDKKNPMTEDATNKIMSLNDIKKTLKESHSTQKFHEKNDSTSTIKARSA